ncbi:heat shock protein [Artemisia annua]|uniref:Heat shock protein n=1 Tax=Artemisia annua TaxID=35608 RepID=A0A2U1LTE2_ARTAN|nr:heat shock protein [Artemisia annua]
MLIGHTINCFGTSTKVIANLQHCLLNCIGASFDYGEDSNSLGQNDGSAFCEYPEDWRLRKGCKRQIYGWSGLLMWLRILDGAHVVATQLSSRYITGRCLPNKAIDLMDEACANVRVQLGSQPEEIDNLSWKSSFMLRKRKKINF